jgi:molybdopterin-guanine dinucleotide biosynthesis protein B
MPAVTPNARLTRYFTDCPLPVLAVVARSGSGKTTLLSRLIPLLRDAGVRVGVIKHSHHDVQIDQPGKDSHRLREAGAQQVMLASPHRCFWIAEGDGVREPGLAGLLQRLDSTGLDLVLLEGYRHAAVAKLEVYRAENGAEPLALQDPQVIAVASNTGLAIGVPCLDLDDPAAVRDFLLQQLGWM